jgi:hypothetical protein
LEACAQVVRGRAMKKKKKKKMEFYPQGVRRLNLSVNGQKHCEGE